MPQTCTYRNVNQTGYYLNGNAYLKFQSNSTVHRLTRTNCLSGKCGFDLDFSASRFECGGVITDEEGEVYLQTTSENKIIKGLRCQYDMRAGIGYRYRIEFFFVEENPDNHVIKNNYNWTYLLQIPGVLLQDQHVRRKSTQLVLPWLGNLERSLWQSIQLVRNSHALLPKSNNICFVEWHCQCCLRRPERCLQLLFQCKSWIQKSCLINWFNSSSTKHVSTDHLDSSTRKWRQTMTRTSACITWQRTRTSLFKIWLTTLDRHKLVLSI